MKYLQFFFFIYLFFSKISYSQTTPSYVPLNGLKAWWSFNGNANDESSFGNNGIVVGPVLSDDRYCTQSSSYKFSRTSSQHIYVPNSNSLDSLSNITISLWFNISSYLDPNSCCGYNHFINKSDQSGGVQFVLASNNIGFYFYYGAGPNYFQTNTLPSLNQWHNLILTYSHDSSIQNSKCKFYLDNICVDSFLTTANLSITSYPILIGSFGNQSYNTVDGSVDDIGIWNRILSNQEISALYSHNSLVTLSPLNQTLNLGDTAKFHVSSSAGSILSYQWQTDLGLGYQNLTNTGQYSGVNSDTLIIDNLIMQNNNQLFRCIVTTLTCTDTTSDTTNSGSIAVINNSGIEEYYSNKITIYPNPTSQFICFNLSLNTKYKEYSIYDILGNILVTGKITSQHNIIDLQKMSPGIYFMKIDGTNNQYFKIIKE
jgi:hypothetical protein